MLLMKTIVYTDHFVLGVDLALVKVVVVYACGHGIEVGTGVIVGGGGSLSFWRSRFLTLGLGPI